MATHNFDYFSYGQPTSEIYNDGQFLWYGSESGIVKYNKVTEEKEYFITGQNETYIGELLLDQNDNIWFVSHDYQNKHGLYKFDGTTTVVFDSTNSPLGASSLTSLYLDENNYLWIGSYSDGLFEYDIAANTWTEHNTSNSGIPSNRISSILKDRQNDYFWVGTWGGGVCHYTGSSWAVYDSTNGCDISWVNSMDWSYDGSLWLGCYAGLFNLNNEVVTVMGDFYKVEQVKSLGSYLFIQIYDTYLKYVDLYNPEILELPYSANSMCASGNGMYISNYYDFTLFNPYGSEPSALHPGNFAFTGNFEGIDYDQQNNCFWTMKEACLAKYDYSNWTYYTQENAGIDVSRMTYFTLDNQGVLWALMNFENYVKFVSFDGNIWTIHPEIATTSPYFIKNIIFDNANKLWCVYNNRLAYYENDQIQYASNEQVSTNSQIVIDADNNKWFSTNTGKIYCFNGTSFDLKHTIANPDMYSNYVSTILPLNEDDFWFTAGANLYHEYFNALTTFPIPQPAYCVSDLVKDADNNFWLTSGYSLLKFDGTTFTIASPWIYTDSYNTNQLLTIDQYNNKLICNGSQLVVYNENGTLAETNVAQNHSDLALNNYPNPFNPETTISFNLPTNGKVDLAIYNIKGQKVKSLLNESLLKGNHSIVWKGSDDSGKHVASGVYFYKLTSKGSSQIKKMLLMK